MNRNAKRLTSRSLAVAMLLLGAVSAGYLGQDREPTAEAEAELSVAMLAEIEMLERMGAERERADRKHRTAVREATERAEVAAEAAAQRVGRAEEAAVQPSTSEAAESDIDSPTESIAVPDSCGDFTGNRATGCALLLDRGHGLDQMPCLDNLWTKESGWNHRAQNPSSGAYGIPQALPGDKMATSGADWRTNPATQIRWGLSYIENRYGEPCAAWSFSQANNWY